MRKGQILGICLILVMILVACAPKVAPAPAPPAPAKAAAPEPALAPAPLVKVPAKPAWQAEWEKVLAEAKNEGKMVITTFLGSTGRTVITEGFKKAYGISIEAITARGSQTAEKVIRERRAGLYNYDVYISGVTTAINSMKPAGAFDPLESAFILPDVTDPELIKKVWEQGKLPWVDADHTHISPSFVLVLAIAINTNLVKEGEIKSYRDLLNPKWKGKLVLNDPTVAGTGGNFATLADTILGWDYLVELAKAKPIVLRDERLMLDWLTRGKVAVAIAPPPEALKDFIQIGAPVKGLIPEEGTWLTGSASNLSLYNRSPHPNAAKIFINWYLTKEGQTIVAPIEGSQSCRLDVPDYLPPEYRRQSGVKYFVSEQEKVILATPALQKRAKELLEPLMK